MLSCPLCQFDQATFLIETRQRSFYRCNECELIYVPAEYFLSAEEELTHYSSHQNSPEDLDYRKFLSRLFEPMQARLQPHCSGLDFGSGPGPTLSVMFEEAGHSMQIYDCFYANHSEVFDQKYDFISATEVFEHLHAPRHELERILTALKPGGLLGVMTMHPPELAHFENWHYITDPTHVCFYSRSTFEWIAEYWGMQCDFAGKDITLFQRI